MAGECNAWMNKLLDRDDSLDDDLTTTRTTVDPILRAARWGEQENFDSKGKG
jgi:hypothetical protein